jgi:hypothetical protein
MKARFMPLRTFARRLQVGFNTSEHRTLACDARIPSSRHTLEAFRCHLDGSPDHFSSSSLTLLTIILPIPENMNNGKSYTFLSWAAINAWVPIDHPVFHRPSFSYSNSTSPVVHQLHHPHLLRVTHLSLERT